MKHGFGYNRSSGKDAPAAITQTFIDERVRGIRNIQQCDQRAGIEKNGVHLRQFRSRIFFLSG